MESLTHLRKTKEGILLITKIYFPRPPLANPVFPKFNFAPVTLAQLASLTAIDSSL